MKKIFTYVLLAFLSFGLVLCVTPYEVKAENSDYYIKNYDVDITINSDRTYDVVETLDVYFNNECHGLVRNIPTYSTQEREVRIKDVNVSGAPFEYDGYGTIKIGDSDKTVKGDVRYTIKYTLWQYADEATDFDFAYIDVMGTEWDTYTENFTACLHFPEGATLDSYFVTSGGYGSTENELNIYNNSDLTKCEITLSSSAVLEAYEGVTIKIFFPEGTFSAAEVYVPDLSFNNIKVSGKLNNEGMADITVNYNITVNNASGFIVDLCDSDEYSRSKVTGYTIKYPYGSTKSDGKNLEYAYVDLYDYEGETVDVTLNFTKQYYFRAGVRELEYIQPLYSGSYSTIGNNIEIEFEFPFDVDDAELRNSAYFYSYYYSSYDSDSPFANQKVSIDKNKVSVSCALDSGSDYYLYAHMPATNFVYLKSVFDAIFPALATLMVLLVLYFVFVSPRFTSRPVPSMYPPEGMTPAEIGCVLNGGKLNRECIAAMVIYWASLGYITIKMEGKNIVLSKVKSISNARVAEKKLFAYFWQNGNIFRTNERNYDYDDCIDSAERKIQAAYGGKNGTIELNSKIFSYAIGAILPVLCILFAVIAMAIRGSVDPGIFAMNIILSFIVPFLVRERGYSLEKKMYFDGCLLERILSGIYVLFLMVLAASYYEIASAGLVCRTGIGFIYMIVCYITIFAGPFMKRSKNKEILTQIIGYKMFLKHMPLDKMQVLLSYDKNAYYNVLPYAMVLGNAKAITKSFASLENGICTPSWYVSSSDLYGVEQFNFDYHYINKISNGVACSIGIKQHASSSSDGGYDGSSSGGGSDFGGGFSGGGSGGGGGTSW